MKSTLKAVQEATRFGLVHTETLHPVGEDFVLLRLTVTHVPSGEELISEYPLPTRIQGASNQSQAFGSALTYGKKYLLWGAYGLANDDDDGESCNVVNDEPSSSRGKKTSPLPNRVTPKEQESIDDLLERRAVKMVLAMRAFYKSSPDKGLAILESFTKEFGEEFSKDALNRKDKLDFLERELRTSKALLNKKNDPGT